MIQDEVLLGLIGIAEGVKGIEGKDPLSWATPVTVNVQGLLMAGYVISRTAYLKTVMDSFRKAKVYKDADESAEEAEQRFQAFTKATDHASIAFVAEKNKNPHVEIYLHLGNVSVLNFSSEEGVLIQHTAWRVRMDEISSFMVGHPKVR